MGDDRGLWWDPQPASIRAYRLAEMADSVAFTLERLAATYQRMAREARSKDKTARLLAHVARLENLIEHERAEATRLRQLLEP
jgi:hypothetical protein